MFTAVESDKKVELVDICKENIKIVQKLIQRIFPIDYSRAFYKQVVNNGRKDCSKLMALDGVFSGVLVSRLEKMNENAQECMVFWDQATADSSCLLADFSPIPTKAPVKYSPLCEKVKNQVVADNLVDSIPCCSSSNDDENKAINKFLYIAAIGVVVPCRNAGLGEYMMEHVFRLAYMTETVKCVTLHVQTTNEDALRFYKRLGFKLVRKIERFYPHFEPSSGYMLIWIPEK